MENSEKQTLTLDNRERLCVSGVEDIESFNDESVILYTNLGVLIVKGENLHINKLSVESGESIVEGEINSCEYKNKGEKRRGEGIFAKMFR